MAKRSKPTPPPHHPHSINWRGTGCEYTGQARITGDLLYTGTKSDQSKVHVIVTNPEARSHQREYLRRGG